MKPVVRTISQWAITIHIYLSMAGFLLILLFAVTGLLLNHANFGLSLPRIETSTLTLPPDLLKEPAEREIVLQLRRLLDVTSPVTLYKEFPDEIEVVFAAPGRHLRVVVNRAERTAMVEAEQRGLLGALGDLHKGSDSGRLWSWVIDLTAVLLTITSMTGLVALALLPARRRAGFLVGAIGMVLTVLLYLAFIPR